MGMRIYTDRNNTWIPGVNTSGMGLYAAKNGGDIEMLRDPRMPTQTFDWMTPSLEGSIELGNTRAERMQTLINDFGCPTNASVQIDFLYPPGLNASPDAADFGDEFVDAFQPLSYLMPGHFQFWGQDFDGARRIVKATNGTTFPALIRIADEGWAAVHRGRYQSKLEQIGNATLKIAAADATRFLDFDGSIDFNVDPAPRFSGDPFGSFCSNGAWWCGAQAYGVAANTTNWDNLPVNSGTDDPHGQGENMLLSYRHGCGNRNSVPRSAQDNEGAINALFFDGHIERLNDRQSREIQLWYPRGARVNTPNAGMTTVPFNFEVP